MIRRCVVVGGAGAVGRLFAERLLAGGARVAVADTVEPGAEPAGTHYVRGDVTAPGARLEADLGHADLVVLAVPDAVALAAVPGLAEVLRPDALLVDTLSVKQPVTAALRAHAPAVQAVGLNPMFAPALGFEGRPVAAVVVNDGPRVGPLLELVGSWGARVVPMDAAEHDRLAGASQALTHAAVLGFGLALTRLGPDMGRIREIAPPPHNALLALLARISSGAPAVYRDVQAANPEAAAVRRELAEGVRVLADLVEHGSEEDFAALLGRLRGQLGEHAPHYRDLCARMFTSL
ncbi:prephenate dehydrogenase/arogenate dehydrogenase family protein [Streptomyces spongiicola]|uniref:Prephenate dehydrogenase/arogenate dehydrogenase family protein n=1 Tax=Streptomyces spongiicola TaxID=1690221 RepID=A0A2S1Z2X6_9ACTN|nr:prephenate dehydrogenase [Streptomyces spongiicola]AWK10727.1 prephenate dehydrogenase/arogenate dehydrogenase family protein [Streptomyces spongiicola]GBQ03699.1 prephenate dehydrogenase/arogenate dehydrogenase family protein [Streptomyces spongiicola]